LERTSPDFSFTIEKEGATIALSIRMPGVDPAEAQALAKAAGKVCPYSNTVRNNIDVELNVD